MLFSYCYRTTDGKTWGAFLEAPDWESGLDMVAELQGFMCGAVAAIVDQETGACELDEEPPPCPPHLIDHPAARMRL